MLHYMIISYRFARESKPGARSCGTSPATPTMGTRRGRSATRVRGIIIMIIIIIIIIHFISMIVSSSHNHNNSSDNDSQW